MIPISAQIKCVERELSKRNFFYPKWIAEGRANMTQGKAAKEISEMEAVLKTLEQLAEKDGKQLGLGISTNQFR